VRRSCFPRRTIYKASAWRKSTQIAQNERWPWTAPYLKDSPNWLLKGSYLTKHYGPGKELTRHIKVGRAKAYLYVELLVLRDRKAANEDYREERH
jgi:hypothetical protein